MSFLTPWTIAIAAGLTIPPLIALYFLKLKRVMRLVPTTLLWKKAVEDLQVNAPFQRLRRSLLLLLQLLVLAVAALALGKPMFQSAEVTEGTVMMLVDQSASMSVQEADGRTRLAHAKEQAKQALETLADDARVMVIAFCDRAQVASSFETDKGALRRKIDSIEQTDSTSTLSEAMSLAEAYAQQLMIGGEQPGTDVAPEPAAPPATVYLFTDGQIEDAGKVALERFDAGKVRVVNVGKRSDNVGIIAMAASRNYERPEWLEVTAAVQNFGAQPVTVDATLYIDGRSVDVQTISIDAAPISPQAARPTDNDTTGEATFSHVQLAAFDQIMFEGGGLVEVVLQVDDALSQDDRAWTVIDPPRRTKVLLVTEDNFLLRDVLPTLNAESHVMSPAEYEDADDDQLIADGRSAFDVVILDRHSTERLPQGNYLFFASAPKIEGVSTGRIVDDEIIFDWDETHPVLRYVAVETVDPLLWTELTLPADAVEIVHGQKTSVIAYLTREASQFLLVAFSILGTDDEGRQYRNGNWVVTMDFVVMMQNMVQFLAASVAVQGARAVLPGEPVTAPIPQGVDTARVHRPDGIVDSVPAAGYQSIYYAQTRRVGPYRIEPGLPRHDLFAVNLFNTTESDVTPAEQINLGGATVAAQSSNVPVNRPAWQYFLLALLVLLILEWIVYNRRVFV